MAATLINATSGPLFLLPGRSAALSGPGRGEIIAVLQNHSVRRCLTLLRLHIRLGPAQG